MRRARFCASWWSWRRSWRGESLPRSKQLLAAPSCTESWRSWRSAVPGVGGPGSVQAATAGADSSSEPVDLEVRLEQEAQQAA